MRSISPADVNNAGVKLLGAPIGTRDFTTEFVNKKLKALDEVRSWLFVIQQDKPLAAHMPSGFARRCSGEVRQSLPEHGC